MFLNQKSLYYYFIIIFFEVEEEELKKIIKKKKKMSTACLPLFAPISPSIATKKLTPKKISPFNATARKLYGNSMTCKAAAAASSSSSNMDFDLYDLLGVDSSSHQSQIKLAYRTLQKRCHPDIAGPAGHDMAIILNEVYSILSDSNLRSAYDKVCVVQLMIRFLW